MWFKNGLPFLNHKSLIYPNTPSSTKILLMLPADPTIDLLLRAAGARAKLIEAHARDGRYDSAFRLFNGFLEGWPDLVMDIYGRTLVVFNYADDPEAAQPRIEAAWRLILAQFPWINTVCLKTRASADEEKRRGVLVHGSTPARKIREHGIWYALNLTLNIDASFYLDTRSLRAWAAANLSGRRVLNTFAYTGSLGVAAAAGGASEVLHLDLNRRFMNLAKDSYALNGLPVRRADFLTGDFWTQINALKRAGRQFDCVFVDPPFFSTTARGTVDLVSNSRRVINKVRPLVSHEGWLVVINNALFLSGADFLAMLEALCADGYLAIESLLPVPPDCAGYPETRAGSPPADPAPFNHSTKIVLLRVRRKEQRSREIL